MGQSSQVGPGTGVEIPGKSQKTQSSPSILPSTWSRGALSHLGRYNAHGASVDACLHYAVKQDISIRRASQHCPSSLCTVSLSATGNRPSSLLLLLSYSLKDIDSRVQSLRDTCSRLPQDSYNNLRCFVRTGLLQPQAITEGNHSLLKSLPTKTLPSFHPTGI